MLSQEAANGALAASAVTALLLSIGLFVMNMGLIRARHWMMVWYPLSIVMGGLAYFSINPLFSTWIARIVVSFVGAVLITLGTKIILLATGTDIDQWDKKDHK